MQNQNKMNASNHNWRKNLFMLEGEKSTGYLKNRHLLRKAVKHTPWLISASAAWLALFPCGLAFAADPNPPLTDTNTKYDIKGTNPSVTISGGRLSISSVDTSEVWYVIANWAAAGSAVDGQTTLPDGAIIGQTSTSNVWYVVGSYAPNGLANRSSVSATNATVYGDIIGGDGAGGALDNTVMATGTTVTRYVYGGRCDDNQTENDSASGNSVVLINSNVGRAVAGGFTNYGNVQSNTVTLTGSTVTNYEGIFGGHTLNGIASSNVVEVLSGSTILGGWPIAGGYAASGTANSNAVTVSGNSTVATTVYGGYASADASSNTVILSDSTAAVSLYGGYAYGGSANSNSVSGTNSTVGWDVYGGQGTTEASSNTVDLSNVQVAGSVGGGNTTSGEASNNSVSLSNGTTFTGNLYAGYTENGNATGNEISLSDVSAPQYVYASYTSEGQAGGTVTLSNSSVTNSVYGGFTHDGVADGSKVTGTNSKVGDSVYGGRGTTGASSNTVDLDNVQVTGSVSGGYTDSGDASDNAVILSNGTTFTGDLYAGYTENGNATGNNLTLSGITAPGSVRAGYTLSGDASGTVTITDSTITGDVYGGYTESGTANNSNVTIIDSTISDSTADEYSIGSSVYAGYTRSGEASHNQVTVSGSNASIQGRVYGGYGSLDSSYNTVKLSEGARVGDDVVGGHSAGDSSTSQNVLYNEVTVSSGSRVEGGLYGGVITEGLGTVQYNTVNLDNASVGYDVVGGGVLLDAPTGSVENNAVNISAGTVEGSVYGGAFEYSLANDPGNSDIINNTVSLSEGAVISGSVFGGYSSGIGNAIGNEVTVSDSSQVDGDVYGGMAEGNNDSNPGNASQNSVRIESGSTVGGSVYGGWNSNGETIGNFIYVNGTASGGVTAGYTLSGDAAGNEVLVEGGTVLDHLYGGYTALGSATGNVVTVKGGTVNAEIVGGYDDGTATNNTVTLYDSARFTGSDIYGGKSGGSSSDVFTGNTFKVYGQIDAASLQNFQNLNFYDVAEDKASVDLSRSAVIGDGKGSMTNVFIGNLRNQEGDIAEEYVLIHTPTASSSYNGTNLYVNGNTVVTIGPDGSYVPYSGTVANDGTMDNATGSTGMTKSQTLTKGFLTFEVDYFIKNGQDLIARWKKDAPVEVNSETEEFAASRQASAALMDEGADFVAGEGIDRALQASQCLPGEPCGAKAFVAVNGGYSTYKAGTTFDMSYGNMLVGIARQCKIGPMGYLAGVFFETGLGRFHSEYEPDDSRSIDSEGHDYYYGVGALAKVFLNRDLLKGLYAEGSIRYGLMMGDWQSHDIQADGQTADWDGRAPYLTAHGGLGYMWDVTDNVTADVYAKYFWGHLWGDDGTICGQQFEFDDVYSSRVRTGARLNFKKDETFSWYLGAAWEHQFDAKSTGSIYGYDVPSTDLRGNTAIAEAGVFFKPAADSDFSFILGTTGYFGEKREGVTGHLQVRYDF